MPTLKLIKSDAGQSNDFKKVYQEKDIRQSRIETPLGADIEEEQGGRERTASSSPQPHE